MPKGKPKVLLTSVYGPFETFEDGSSMMDLYAGRLTKGQEIFTIKSYYPSLPLYLIAENISAPAVVLEFPTLKQFTRELRKGYDYVGIHFAASLFFDKVLTMCRLIRKISPKTKIVLGGYGVVCVDQDFQNEADLRELVDYVCRGEGVRFMRELVGDPVDAPISENFPQSYFRIMSVKIPFNNLITAVGCRAGCEFCATSAFFKRDKIFLLSPSEFWAALKNYIKRGNVWFTWVFNEDFFADPEYVREFGRIVESDKEVSLDKIVWGGFGSVRALSQYDVEELVRMGVQAVWVGIESKYTNLPKRQGKSIKEIFESLHSAGIMTIGSFIVGWDFHTSETVKEDIEHVVSLNPTFSQISSLMPCPGTKFWDRMLEEKRLRTEDFKWKGFHLYAAVHKHLHMTDDEVRFYVRETQRRLYEENGPSVLRMLEVVLNGYARYRDAPDRRLRERASYFMRQAKVMYPTLLAIRVFAPSEKVRDKVAKIRLRYRREIGHVSPVSWCASFLFLVATVIAKISSIRRHKVERLPCRRTCYNGAR